MSDLKGQSALTMLNQKASNLQFEPHPEMPPEIMGKTVAQLKAMGATELAHIDTRSDVKYHGMSPQVDVNLSPESQEKLR